MGAGMRRDGTQAAALEAVAPPPARDRPLHEDAAFADAWRALWVSRALVLVVGACAAALWGLSARVTLFDPGAVTRPFGPLGNALAAPLARWDSVWYLAIANDGYPADDPRRAAFFPLYPLLVRAANAVVGRPVIAGALVSLACFAVALVLLHRLTEIELGGPAASEAVWALALFPGAVFFSAVYSEALYLALSIGCLYAVRTGRWGLAGAAGAARGGVGRGGGGRAAGGGAARGRRPARPPARGPGARARRPPPARRRVDRCRPP